MTTDHKALMQRADDLAEGIRSEFSGADPSGLCTPGRVGDLLGGAVELAELIKPLNEATDKLQRDLEATTKKAKVLEWLVEKLMWESFYGPTGCNEDKMSAFELVRLLDNPNVQPDLEEILDGGLSKERMLHCLEKYAPEFKDRVVQEVLNTYEQK